ncbi:hypothetical protein CALVIDRAFT_564056 [Calocera viscosa TUFC12733]|uniref:Uncharacterized protein n=1 Tax=Calocera viscosa (strain TUFC12733) TaxID=1330018 RepID=A0A167LYQ6_CALVF|nr:hypothetical protein CALVIDRAFT_564056 [Calocera viscosa TUFC12733]
MLLPSSIAFIVLICILSFIAFAVWFSIHRLRSRIRAERPGVSPRTLEALHYRPASPVPGPGLHPSELRIRQAGVLRQAEPPAPGGEQLPSYQAAGKDPLVPLPVDPPAIERPPPAMIRESTLPPVYEEP